MIDKYILQPIEPFNEIYYKNCFYNSFFPILHHFRKSIYPIIVNDVIIYKDHSDRMITADYLPIKTFKDILKHMGLQIQPSTEKKDVIERIISSVSQSKPVILWVDCYFEPMRKDTYLKQHLSHTWMIYGFDKKQSIFNIIEHQKLENLSYGKYTIGFSDLIQCYEAYLENYISSDADNPNMFSFCKNEINGSTPVTRTGNSRYLIELIDNLKLQREAIEQGVSVLEKYFQSLQKIVTDQQTLQNNTLSITYALTDIINAKLIEQYRFEKLNGINLALYPYLLQIIESFNFIRANIVRFKYSMRYDKDIMSTTIEKMQDILVAESKCLEAIQQI